MRKVCDPPRYINTHTISFGDGLLTLFYRNPAKKMTHEAASLPSLVENLVKNWEVEASFKPDLKDWRTIDHANYSFAINGGPPQTAEHMLEVGTYNAIIAPNEFYSPANSDFASSHKTFKRMMPTFAWEVIEVYSGPPTVAFRWRHWGQMKNDYVGFNEFVSSQPPAYPFLFIPLPYLFVFYLGPLKPFICNYNLTSEALNSKGEKITAKAHGGPIEIEGITVATVDDQVRLQKVETWFDPLEMFRQIAPNGVVNKVPRTSADDHDDEHDEHDDHEHGESADVAKNEDVKAAVEEVNGALPEEPKEEESKAANKPDEPEIKQAAAAEPNKKAEADKGNQEVHELTKDFEQKSSLHEESAPATAPAIAPATATEPPVAVVEAASNPNPAPTTDANADIYATRASQPPADPPGGDAVAAPASSEEAQRTHEELSRITRGECPFMNQE